jgi:hypothetical protein
MPGFDFSNYNRNAALHAQGVPLPKATSTGTTIVGCIFDGGVVIAADTRATSGPIVADKVSLTRRVFSFVYFSLPYHFTHFDRTVRNYITYHPIYGVPVRVQPPIPNSQPPLSRQILSYMPYQQVGNHES